MAEIGRFFDGPAYGAQAHAEFYTNFLSTGFFWGLDVNANDTLQVTVASGAAFLEGHEYRNTEALNLEHNIADSTNDRIDRVVIRLDNTPEAERPLRVMVRSGVPNSNPEPPELVRNDAIYEISLAQVLVEAGKSFIEQYQITDERGDIDLCGRVSQPRVLTDQVDTGDIKRPAQRASEYPRGHSVFYLSGSLHPEIMEEWLDAVGFDHNGVDRALSSMRAYVETNAQYTDTGMQSITIFDWARGWDYQIYGKFSRTTNSAFGAMPAWGSWHEEVLVYDQGDNSNGRYIRYTNGWQECWFEDNSAVGAGTEHGTTGLHWGTKPYNFPASFSGTPHVLPYSNRIQTVQWSGVTDVTENECLIYIIALSDSAQGYLGYKAEGRWRE